MLENRKLKNYFVEAPVILSVEQTSERTAIIKWNIDNTYDVTRYRLFFTDNGGSRKEWPSILTNFIHFVKS